MGLASGCWLWQLTDGESWLQLEALTRLANFLAGIRTYLSERIFYGLPEPHDSLLTGILLGNKVKLDYDLLQQFRAVGLSHIIAVSGYNLTIVSQNIQTILGPLLGVKRSVYLSMIAIFIFVLLTGAPASIIRAGVMSVLLMAGTLLGRPTQSLSLLVVGASLIAAFQPKIIFDVGFQLSVFATYALLRLTPILQRITENWIGPKTIYQNLGETLAATVVTAPIIIYYFQQFSAVSVATNILVLPFIPLLMAVGALGLLASIAAPLVAAWAFWGAWPLLQWIIFITQKSSELPHSLLHFGFSLNVTILMMAALIALTEIGRVMFLPPNSYD